jgi:hypothetical protein
MQLSAGVACVPAGPMPDKSRGAVTGPVSPPQQSVPKPLDTGRTYVPLSQLRLSSHIWLPWDVSEDVVRPLLWSAAVRLAG